VLNRIYGMRLGVIRNRTREMAIAAYTHFGVSRDRIVNVSSAGELSDAMSEELFGVVKKLAYPPLAIDGRWMFARMAVSGCEVIDLGTVYLMGLIPTTLKGATLIELDQHEDDRGDYRAI
jgi:hypothetical protein